MCNDVKKCEILSDWEPELVVQMTSFSCLSKTCGCDYESSRGVMAVSIRFIHAVWKVCGSAGVVRACRLLTPVSDQTVVNDVKSCAIKGSWEPELVVQMTSFS